ncbi:MAG: chromosome segregation protein SMC [Brachymonas sp.]
MRLQSIKLSGFKSFAEATNFHLPGQLVGVVGPNGCGKSNIMDAVRWVLGESRASELRGESMQDVIFNGTTTRKPASRASVELVFNNDAHRAGGQWNQFSEIAVKRVLTRDGNSSYYINNQVVRRRDIQDVFLGTGLGPRAYAIIGQGTISRIIESRPEELRLFLEEAAGVSKYKERRRETENRLHDTRENMTRVEDILRELGNNLEHLEKQAEVATQYHALHSQHSQRQQQQWLLRRQQAQSHEAKLQQDVLQAVNAVESQMADLRAVEAGLETVRQSHYAAGEAVNQAQNQMYQASAEVGKLEAEIRYANQSREQARGRLQQLQEQSAMWQERIGQGQEQQEDATAQLEGAQEQAEILSAQAGEQGSVQPMAEEALRQTQAAAGAVRQQVTQVQQQMQLLSAEQRHVGEQLGQISLRRERLQSDKNALQIPDGQLLAGVQSNLSLAQEQAAELAAQLEQLQEDLPEQEAQRAQLQQVLEQDRHIESALRAKLEALNNLQERVKTDGKLRPWLEKQGLDHLQALWQKLHIETGWENALEAALRERMQALEFSQIDTLAAFAHDAPSSKLVFYSPPSGATQAAAPTSAHGIKPLADYLRLQDASLRALLGNWLTGAYTASDLRSALAQRSQLAPGELIYTPQGHCVAAHSVHFYAQDNEQAGQLARAQEIENLHKQLKAQSMMVETAAASLQRANLAYNDGLARQTGLRAQAQNATAKVHELQIEALRLAQLAEQSQARASQIAGDLEEAQGQEEALLERQIEAESRFESLDLELADAQEAYTAKEDALLAAQKALDDARLGQRHIENQAKEAEFAVKSLQAKLQELQRNLQLAEQQLASVQGEAEQAEQTLAASGDSSMDEHLQQALVQKLACEEQLLARRNAYEELSQKLRASDERRLQIDRSLEPLRQRITDLKMQEQAASIAVTQYQQQLQEAQADEAVLAASIQAEGVELGKLQGEIDRLARAIAALGAVNLAALDELTAARERKGFLDAQMADLLAAITTLEDAIRKIDAETRDLLMGTFNQVNEHFGRMFPSLFGGGQAKLSMTGGEILDAGVQVMAQPPGKKNQTIHLLSGGEKALTAIALVFAIFQLNPAPFCLLDEVDAPLDDANTERYAKLVASMSSNTQFLFISHNKIAMEIAQQLVGVTMQEQGVSRIVAVDMETASGMMEAETV